MDTYEIIMSITNIVLALFSIFVVFTVIVTYRQYTAIQKQHKKESDYKERDNDYEKKKRACELAQYFEEHIVSLISYIEGIITSSNENAFVTLNEIFPSDIIKEFDYDEMMGLLLKASKDISFVAKLFEATPAMILGNKHVQAKNEMHLSFMLEFYSDIISGTDNVNMKGELLKIEYDRIISEVLNKLEWFSMNFHYGIADENTVYQSLHQMFLSTICSLYYYIAIQNKNNPDKLFTNVIWLYNLWNERLVSYQEEQHRKQKEAKGSIHEATPVG